MHGLFWGYQWLAAYGVCAFYQKNINVIMQRKRILAIIPARGGSKGLPGKNIYPVGVMQQPLIEFTMEAASKCELITETFVCTEDAKIRDIVLEIGQRQYFMNNCSIITRPLHLAGDNTTCEAVMHFCIQLLKDQGLEYDYVMLLQPTSPLRTAADITEAINQYTASTATSLISVYEPAHHPLKSFTVNKQGLLNGIVDNESPFMNRQQLPQTVMPNGAIYITTIKHFIKTGTFFAQDSTIPYIMPEARSIDVDTIEDIKAVEKYLASVNNH